LKIFSTIAKTCQREMKLTQKHHSHRKKFTIKPFRLKYLFHTIEALPENKNIEIMNNSFLKKFLNQNFAALKDHATPCHIKPKPSYLVKLFIGLKKYKGARRLNNLKDFIRMPFMIGSNSCDKYLYSVVF
jgi:hypothetical protein